VTPGYTTTAMLFVSGQPTVDEEEAITSQGPGGRFTRLPTVNLPGEGRFDGAVYAATFEWTRDDVIVGFCQRMPLNDRDVILYARGQGADRPRIVMFEHVTGQPADQDDAAEPE
jgi:hypothetical protein